ncbi:MAG: FHIPEP family type III secretion protein, partial [Planctomycetota bacterium]|nr:FHIPEP family type III secretion protein [Planctomycetota bacterium]
TREETNTLITQLKEKAPKLTEEVLGGETPLVKPGELQKVLQNLLAERVPIRDLETVVETLGDLAGRTKDLDVLTEYVRHALRRGICQQYAAPADPHASPRAGSRLRLVCVTLDPAFEDVINGSIDRSGAGTAVSMPARVANAVANRIIESLKPVIAAGHQPVVIASPQVRAVVHQLLTPHLPAAAVLGYNEIVSEVEVESMALVTMPEESTSTAAVA